MSKKAVCSCKARDRHNSSSIQFHSVSFDNNSSMLQVRAEADAARARICGPTRAAKSDHVATVYAFNEFRRVRGDRGLRGARHWCGDNFVSFDAMEAIAAGRGEYANCLAELNFVTHGMLPCCQ